MSEVRRSTPLKKAILEILSKHHLLTAAELLEKLHSQGLKANKTSVYRNLDAFVADNIVCQQSFGNEEFAYELQSEHHDHIQCHSCGKVEAIPCQTEVPKKLNGFIVNHHHLTLEGTCQDCNLRLSSS